MPSDSPIRFGVFELDLAARELRKRGVRVKLQDQPFRVLAALLEKPGEVVTREELKERLWAQNEFVEFDKSLSTAVQKIRQALGDSASAPRFLETLPKVGYRFIAPLQTPPAETPSEPRPGGRRLTWAFALAALGLALALAAWRPFGDESPEAIAIRPEPLTSLRGAEFAAELSPDGESLVFVRQAEGRADLDVFVQLIGAGDPVPLSTDPRIEFSPTWSPDGKRVAFLRHLGPGEDRGSVEAEIVVAPALGGAESSMGVVTVYRSRLQVKPYSSRILDWSPQGNKLAVVQHAGPGSSSIVAIDLNTHEQRPLAEAGEYLVHNRDPAYSPDGSRLAYAHFDHYVTHIEILELGRDGLPAAAPTRIEGLSATVDGLAWAPDGRSLVAALAPDGVSELWKVPVGEGAPTRIRGAGYGARSPSVAQETGDLVYEQERLDTNIWRIPGPLSGEQAEPERVVSSTRQDQAPRYSPDGGRIAFWSTRTGSAQIWTANPDGSSPAQVTATGGSKGTVSWSPDGRFLSYESRIGGNADIYIVSSAGGEPRRLTQDAAAEALSSWSRNGESLYFTSDRDGEHHVWKIPAEGGEAARVTDREGRESHESPDGKFLYFTPPNRLSGGLWRRDLDSGEEELIAPEASRARWAVIDSGIVYLTSGAGDSEDFRFVDFAGDRTRTFATLPSDVAFWGSPIFDVSPDGRWLVYSALDEYESDLMIVRAQK